MIDSINGSVGVEGCGLITTSGDWTEVQPKELVTVKVKVPASSPVIVLDVPVPVVVMDPGFLIKVHDPDDGNPLNATLPADIVHVVCVMVPIVGAAGVKA